MVVGCSLTTSERPLHVDRVLRCTGTTPSICHVQAATEHYRGVFFVRVHLTKEASMHKHICRVGTGRIDYRGHSQQTVLNTTVKSGSGLGKVFAPTWDMVMGVKQGKLTWEAYTEGYTQLMRRRYAQIPAAFLEALSCDELIVCCY